MPFGPGTYGSSPGTPYRGSAGMGSAGGGGLAALIRMLQQRGAGRGMGGGRSRVAFPRPTAPPPNISNIFRGFSQLGGGRSRMTRPIPASAPASPASIISPSPGSLVGAAPTAPAFGGFGGGFGTTGAPLGFGAVFGGGVPRRSAPSGGYGGGSMSSF